MDVVFPLIYMFLLGLCIGSFLNVVIVRLPNGESLVRPGSHCVSCNHPLAPKDNIPLISYIILRGRCRFCGEPISPRYPLVEVLTACLFALCVLRFGFGAPLVAACALCALLIVCAFIDYTHRVVYDTILVIGVLLAVLFRYPFLYFYPETTANSTLGIVGDIVLGAAAGALPLLLIATIGKFLAKKSVMGGGDIKLMAVTGVYLGWQGALLSLVFASIGGGLLLFVLLLARKVSRDQEIPFVPILAFGSMLSLMAGDAILNGYLSLFGIA